MVANFLVWDISVCFKVKSVVGPFQHNTSGKQETVNMSPSTKWRETKGFIIGHINLTRRGRPH